MSKLINLCVLAICFLSAGRSFKIQPRIYNGMESDRGQHPFFVFLEIDKNNSNKQECGGTLIDSSHIITAGHCVFWVKENVRLHFGMHETMNETEEGRKIVSVSRENIKIHPQFSIESKKNDIAIIKMDEPIEFNSYIQPVKFASDCNLDEFTDGIVVGAGYQGSSPMLSQFVQWALLSRVSAEECQREFPFLLDLHSQSSIFCMSSPDYRSACKGDSGSPVIRQFEAEFIGIASFISDEGCENGAPQAFTNVFTYQNWIADVTGLNLPQCEEDEDDYFKNFLNNSEDDIMFS